MTDLVSGGVVDLSSQTLGLGLTGEEVFGLVQTQTEDLSVQVVVLVSQLVVLLWRSNTAHFLSNPSERKCSV